METLAVVLDQPGQIALRALPLTPPGAAGVVIRTEWSGVSTGTERLLWDGRMPAFPGMGYPLVPGYETVGTVVDAGRESGRRAGERVFVPGARCYQGAHGLFGGAASTLVTAGSRTVPADAALGEGGALLALAATAYHAAWGSGGAAPQLIVGHGALGRLLARLCATLDATPPVVWETNPARREGAAGYAVIDPAGDPRRDYAVVCDCSGDARLLDSLVGRCARGAEIVLAGFYTGPVAFDFVPAFLREVRIRVSAEWQAADLETVARLANEGRLPLDGIVTHRGSPRDPRSAYATAFGDPACVKMILDWSNAA